MSVWLQRRWWWCSQWVQLVDRLVLVGPLQVQLDLLHQRDTVGLSDVQFLGFGDAVLLMGRGGRKSHVSQVI